MKTSVNPPAPAGPPSPPQDPPPQPPAPRSPTPPDWRPVPLTVDLAGMMLVLHAALVTISGMVIGAPILASRFAGIGSIDDASAQAPMVWDAVRPLAFGFAVGLVFAAAEVAAALALRSGRIRLRWTARMVACGLAVMAMVLGISPLWGDLGHSGVLFTFGNGFLAPIKPALGAAAVILLLAPSASRGYFRLPR